ncbi:MAG: hypothetical protein WB542_05350, partial [Polaromonas sp.]
KKYRLGPSRAGKPLPSAISGGLSMKTATSPIETGVSSYAFNSKPTIPEAAASTPQQSPRKGWP